MDKQKLFRLPQEIETNPKKIPASKYKTKSKVTTETQGVIVIEYCPIFGMSYKVVNISWDKHINQRV